MPTNSTHTFCSQLLILSHQVSSSSWLVYRSTLAFFKKPRGREKLWIFLIAVMQKKKKRRGKINIFYCPLKDDDEANEETWKWKTFFRKCDNSLCYGKFINILFRKTFNRKIILKGRKRKIYHKERRGENDEKVPFFRFVQHWINFALQEKLSMEN